MKQGDLVHVTYEGKSLTARVVLASPNGRSLLIAWEDGMLGGHVGMMPVFQEEDGEYRSLIEGKPIELLPLVS